MRPGDHISCTLWDILIQQYMSNGNAPTLQSVYSCEENCRRTYTDWTAVSPETTETGVADLFYTVLFNGEEIGITNAGFKDIDSYRDVESLNYYRILREAGKTEAEALEIIGERSRDNGRTPMQWDGTENAGFTTGTPWLGIPENHKTINVENEEQDPDSILAFYRKLVALRKEEPVISDGRIDFEVEVPYGVIAYTRSYEETQLFVWANLTGDEKTVRIPESGKLFLSNYGMEGDIPAGEVLLKPYELLVIKK